MENQTSPHHVCIPPLRQQHEPHLTRDIRDNPSPTQNNILKYDSTPQHQTHATIDEQHKNALH
eukprot:1725554-Ditylum_brightwellii.AAC.1